MLHAQDAQDAQREHLVEMAKAAQQVVLAVTDPQRPPRPRTLDSLHHLGLWSRRWMRAAWEGDPRQGARTTAASIHLDRMFALQGEVQARLQLDATRAHAAVADYLAIDARAALEQALGQEPRTRAAAAELAKVAYDRLEQRLNAGDPLTLSTINLMGFYSAAMRDDTIESTPHPEARLAASRGHAERMATLAKRCEARLGNDTARVHVAAAQVRAAEANLGVARISGENVDDHAKALSDAASELHAALNARRNAGEPLTPEFLDLIYGASDEWRRGASAAAPTRESRVKAATAHVERMKALEKILSGIRGGDPVTLWVSQFYVADAERHLKRASTEE
jgi:hypothetical protein